MGTLYVNQDAANGSAIIQSGGIDTNISLVLKPAGTGALQVTPTLQNAVVTATANAAGTGYVTGDLVAISGGTGTPAILTVTASAGLVTAASVYAAGIYSVNPSATAAASTAVTGTGSGATFALTFALSGDARGANAVDLQRTRTATTQVASGQNSVIFGGLNNTSSATNSMAGGQSCIASGGQSLVIGDNSTASGTSATVFGAFNTADGSYSWAPGGLRVAIRGIYGKGAWGSGMFVAPGDAQPSEQVLRVSGTSATPVGLNSNGTSPAATNTIALPNNGTFLVSLLVTARQTGGAAGTAGDSAGWVLTALVKRGANAASTTLVGGGGAAVAPTYNDAAAAAWRLAVTADTTNGALALTGTGEASKNIQWVARASNIENVG